MFVGRGHSKKCFHLGIVKLGYDRSKEQGQTLVYGSQLLEHKSVSQASYYFHFTKRVVPKY